MQIGFMQGRLSELVDGKIQAFPWDEWRQEFVIAEANNIGLMEWTLDQNRLYENPLMTAQGRQEIIELMRCHKVKISSLTGDCFMQAPFFKEKGARRDALLEDLFNILEACSNLSIKFVLIPLVDNGSLETDDHEQILLQGLLPLRDWLLKHNMQIMFESDFGPGKLAEFMQMFPQDTFGINYDSGNSAGMGFDPVEEFSAYISRIVNVHIKDRILQGKTVPLGTGNADLCYVVGELKRSRYQGNVILQTARAEDGDHAGALVKYYNLIRSYWDEA